MEKGMKSTHYEWIVEPIDKHEDIIDVLHHDTFASALRTKELGYDGSIRIDIALRQRVYYYANLEEQYYNYLEKVNGLWTMQEYFPNVWGGQTDIKVPKRFFKELNLINNRSKK